MTDRIADLAMVLCLLVACMASVYFAPGWQGQRAVGSIACQPVPMLRPQLSPGQP
jgi:hypothetical protein